MLATVLISVVVVAASFALAPSYGYMSGGFVGAGLVQAVNLYRTRHLAREPSAGK